MAFVLCDGSAASLRAIDIAVVPQLVLRQHKDEQLIMIHGYEDVVVASGSQPTPQQLQQQAASLQSVVNATLEQIDKNKHAKDTLNYKIEMLRVSKYASLQAATQQSHQAQQLAASPPPRAATPVSTTGPTSKPGTAGGKGAPQSIVVAPEQEPATTTPVVTMAPFELLGSYVSDRANHHHAHSVILGIGNQSNGKNHVVGRTARELYSRQHRIDDASSNGASAADGTSIVGESSHCQIAPWALWFIKPTGAVIRPGAGVKFLVLLDTNVVNSRPLSALHYTLSKLVQPARDDRVGLIVMTNNNTTGIVDNRVSKGDVGQEEESTAKNEQFIHAARERLRLAGQVEESETQQVAAGHTEAAADHDSTQQQQHSPSPPSTLPLVTLLKLDGTSANPRPNVNDVPQQLVKALAKLKADFLVIPPAVHRTFSEATVLVLLGLLRPHVIVPPSDGDS